MPSEVNPIPSITMAELISIFWMMHKTVTAMPIASPTALKIRLINSFKFFICFSFASYACIVQMFLLKRNKQKRKLPLCKHKLPLN